MSSKRTPPVSGTFEEGTEALSQEQNGSTPRQRHKPSLPLQAMALIERTLDKLDDDQFRVVMGWVISTYAKDICEQATRGASQP